MDGKKKLTLMDGKVYIMEGVNYCKEINLVLLPSKRKSLKELIELGKVSDIFDAHKFTDNKLDCCQEHLRWQAR